MVWGTVMKNYYCRTVLKNGLLALFCLLLEAMITVPVLAQQQGGKFSLSVMPGVNIPLGVPAEAFKIGGGAEITAAYSMPFAPFLTARAALDYSIAPVKSVDEPINLSMITVSLGPGVRVAPFPWLTAYAILTGGYGLGILSGETGGSAFFAGEGGAIFNIIPALSVGAGASYRHYFSQPTPFYQGIRVHVGAIINLGAEQRKPNLRIQKIELTPVFPVFYKYYDDHQVGGITFVNDEKGSVKNLAVSFYVPQYMDGPKQCVVIPELKKGEETTVPLYALFTDKVLAITEGTKINAQITARYQYGNKDFTVEQSQTLRMYDRNAMSWDDDRRAAAFVTAKDPDVLAFAKSVAGLVRDSQNKAVNLDFRIAAGLFESLGLYGIRYVVDPKTPFTEFKGNAGAVDFLQFPVQTLTYKAGDCDDLSILTAAMMEAAGMETAFITVPGHIFMAFNLGMQPDEAKKLFQNPGDLILNEEETWVPVEITLLQEGFLKAWETGAKEWRENNAKGVAGFFPIHAAWTEYEPVGLIGASAAITPPAEADILTRYTSVMNRFVERDIADKVVELTEQIKREPTNPKLSNKLGVLYAQYGMLDKAEEWFTKASDRQYAPAMVNLGNTLFLKGKYDAALRFYTQANDLAPGNPQTLLGMAKANFELENAGNVKRVYEELQRKDPDLAARFSYLVSGGGEEGRASDAMRKDTVVWDAGE